MESHKKLEELITLAVKYGVRKLKTPEFEIEFNEAVPPVVKPQVEPSAAVQEALPNPEISDVDMLFWSSEPESNPSESKE